MKVTAIETSILRVPFSEDYWGRQAWDKDYEPQSRTDRDLDVVYPARWRVRHRWSHDISTVLVQVHTDEGLVGYGESKAPIAPEVVKGYIDSTLAAWLIGQNPLSVRALWDRYQASMRGRGHLQGFHQEAAAGLDIACWDIVGKVMNQPVHTALGGPFRDSVPVYHSALPGLRHVSSDADRAALSTAARQALVAGHTAVKIAIGFGARADLESVRVVREAVGDDVLILVDALGSYDYTQALSLSRHLADLGVGWFETPLKIDDFRGYVELGKRSPVPIANDFLWTSDLLKGMFADGVRMVCIVETIKAGITEAVRIAEMADAYGCGFAPHCSIGSAIQIVANAHVAAAVPNLVIGELWGNTNLLTRELVHPAVSVMNGHMTPPAGAGLGITIDQHVLTQVSAAGS